MSTRNVSPLILLVWVVFTLADIRKCFIAHNNIRITCGEPFEKRSDISFTECGILCGKLEENCLTAQYDHYRKTCDVFNTDSPLGTSNRTRREISARQVDENCKLISLQPTIGTTHLVPVHSCLREYLKEAFRDEPRKPLRDVKFYSNNQTHKLQSLDVRPIKPTVQSAQDPNPVAIEIVPVVPDCPIGETAKIQVIDGVKVDSLSTVSFISQSADHCFHNCKTNSYPSGERLPLLCRSAQYDKSSKKCSAYPDAVNPNGYLEYVPNNQVVYMEKICIPEKVLNGTCDDIFRRIPQHVIMGHASDVLSVSSEQECILECIRSKLNTKLDCQSIMYFPDFSAQNCILNVHTRHTKNPYFTPELIFKVDYVEINQCSTKQPEQRSVIKESRDIDPVPSVNFEWSEWTVCNEKSSTRSRYKYCEGCQEIVQFLPCFNNNNNFDVAVQKFIKDQQHKDPDVKRAEILQFPEIQTGSNANDVQFFGPPILQKAT